MAHQSYFKHDLTPRVKEKLRKRAEEAQSMRQCYRIVDERDGKRCRVCRRPGYPNGTTLLDRLHHHHMVYRSRGGQHEPDSVILLCAICHAAIHIEGTLRVSGDANARDTATGKLAGVKVERYTDAGWIVEKFV